MLILAAGLGSRFGGDKQLVAVGSSGEAFLDYAIRDALDAGVEQIIVVTRTELDQPLREHLSVQHPAELPLIVVHQDAFGPLRNKPWGTGHAVLSAANHLTGPTVILNADDYYGRRCIESMVRELANSDVSSGVLLAFELGRTLPESGEVSRAVCEIGDGKWLRGLVETHGIRREADGFAAGTPSRRLEFTTPVSMNLWGLPAHAIEHLSSQWATFYAKYSDDPVAEFLLPTALDEQLADGRLEIEVVFTDEQWVGVTNRDDLDMARTLLAEHRTEGA